MRTPIKYTALIALYSALLAGCSSAPVESTEIGDASVQAAEANASGVETAELDTQADTVFYFDFDKALLKAESRASSHCGQRIFGISRCCR